MHDLYTNNELPIPGGTRSSLSSREIGIYFLYSVINYYCRFLHRIITAFSEMSETQNSHLRSNLMIRIVRCG